MTTANSKVVPPANAVAPHNGFSLISNEKLLQIYSTMIKCRMLETRVNSLSSESSALKKAVREEAAIAGSAIDLLPGDTLAPSPRGFAAAYVKGLSLESIFAIAAPGKAKKRPPYSRLNLIPPSLSLEVQLDRLIEAAIANKKARKKQIAVAFCGNADTLPEALNEAMKNAGKRKLPILFVCHSAWESDDICEKAKACDFPGVVVDGDDAVAVYRVATEAIAHARGGSGSTLIDCKPWPLPGENASKPSRMHDPIVRMEEYLTRKGLFDPKMKSKVQADFRRELAGV